MFSETVIYASVKSSCDELVVCQYELVNKYECQHLGASDSLHHSGNEKWITVKHTFFVCIKFSRISRVG